MHNRKHQISTPVAPEDATGPSSAEAQRPDPQVVPTAKRRTFSKAEKLRILAAADACVAPGDIGALLRREGIYSSHLATWRKQRELATDGGALERKRGPKLDPAAIEVRRVQELEREVERLRDKLAKADLIIDVQKKLSILLGLNTGDTPSEPK
jgi:transposase-like protein